jgi:hypothetical protein
VFEALDAFIKQKSIALMLKNWQNVQQMFNYSFAIHLLFIHFIGFAPTQLKVNVQN